MSVKPKLKRRSGCPVGMSLDIVGDRWSLLVVRDLMVRGAHTLKTFRKRARASQLNILADRLKKLESAGVIVSEPEPTDGRKVHYRLTEKGIDLAPVLTELLLWGARYESTATPPQLIARLEGDREGFLAEVRRRWHERDMTPLIPKFQQQQPPSTKKGKRH